MRTKPRKFVPPYLDLNLRSDGVNLLSVVTRKHVPPTSREFQADTIVHDSARRPALAVTLCEIALHILQDQYPDIRAALRQAVSLLIIADTPFGDELEKADDPPW